MERKKSPVFNLSIGSSHRVTIIFLPGLQNTFLIIPDCSPYASPPIAVFSFFLWLQFLLCSIHQLHLFMNLRPQAIRQHHDVANRPWKKKKKVSGWRIVLSRVRVSISRVSDEPSSCCSCPGGHCWFWHPWALVWCCGRQCLTSAGTTRAIH